MDTSNEALVDAHVHYYPCFGWARFLEGAAANFEEAARDLGIADPKACFLLLTESSAGTAFAELEERRGEELVPGWQVLPTGDLAVLRIRRADGFELHVVSGRQIECTEGVEVLALVSRSRYRDGRSLRETITEVLEDDSIAVLPWGFGKWSLQRSALVQSIIEDPAVRLHLGDNGGRPAWTPRPRLFRVARAHGVNVLPGSDPLPLEWHADRAGRFGFVLRAALEMEKPSASLKRALRQLTDDPEPFGRRETLLGFVRSQLGLRRKSRVAGEGG